MIRKTTKCYIYTRVSTAIQVDGYSLDAQREKLKKYAEFQEYEIVGEYNLPKNEDSKQPNCAKEKKTAIKDAFKHFGMIS